jgi:5'-deoxynucleotidase YfbR-like HD superfamily hydrolase
VAEHSYFVVLLATLILPPRIAGLPSFSKEETVRVLTLHDIAEAYTGDIIFHKLSEESREKARRTESEVQHYVCWKQTYEGIYDTFRVHERLQSFTTAGLDKRPVDDNVRVARDVDRLENLIQLYVYRDLYGDWITPDEFRNFAESLKMSMHPEMARLADDFAGWAEREHGKIVQEPVKFFDAGLVVSQDNVQKQAR